MEHNRDMLADFAENGLWSLHGRVNSESVTFGAKWRGFLGIIWHSQVTAGMYGLGTAHRLLSQSRWEIDLNSKTDAYSCFCSIVPRKFDPKFGITVRGELYELPKVFNTIRFFKFFNC